MTLAFDFHPEAQAEFAADVEWFDDREVGVGGRFAAAVRTAIDAVCDDPDLWPKWPGVHGDPVVRSKKVADFPYRVVYYAENEMLTVVSVAHAKRRPGYWRDRVSP